MYLLVIIALPAPYTQKPQFTCSTIPCLRWMPTLANTCSTKSLDPTGSWRKKRLREYWSPIKCILYRTLSILWSWIMVELWHRATSTSWL